MVYPVVSGPDGIKIKPEIMVQEKLYHCIFQNKIMLVYKDNQDILHCYEIEEEDLVEQVKSCTDKNDVEQIFVDYVKSHNLND